MAFLTKLKLKEMFIKPAISGCLNFLIFILTPLWLF